MNVFQVELPENLNVSDFELKMWIATRLLEEGRLSSGQAAEIVGLSKRDFLELLGKYNVAFFGYSLEELEEDLKNG